MKFGEIVSLCLVAKRSKDRFCGFNKRSVASSENWVISYLGNPRNPSRTLHRALVYLDDVNDSARYVYNYKQQLGDYEKSDHPVKKQLETIKALLKEAKEAI